MRTKIANISNYKHVDPLRYRCMPTEGIAEALAAYDAAFQGDKVYAEPPVAPYLAGTKYCGNSELEAHDMCYHLLKLYCDKRYPLHKILAPSTYTAAPLDHHLRWVTMAPCRCCVVWSVLREFVYG